MSQKNEIIIPKDQVVLPKEGVISLDQIEQMVAQAALGGKPVTVRVDDLQDASTVHVTATNVDMPKKP